MTGVAVLAPDAPREEWLARRREGIGASEIAAVLGISPWESRFSLYWRKVHGWSVEVTPEMRAGLLLESAIADWWAAELDPHENLVLRPAGLYASAERPWQLATPDRLMYQDYDGWIGPRPVALLECKWVAQSWDGWGEPGTDDIPVYYRAQALHQLDVLGLDEVDVAALGPGGFRAYRVCRDDEDLAVMRQSGARFIADVAAGRVPDVDEHTATLDALKRLHPDVVDEDVEVDAATADGYRRACALAARAQAVKDRYEARLRARMGQARRAVHGGRRVATRSVYTATRLDVAGIRKEIPAVAAAYSTASTVDKLIPARSRP